jgi:predicted phage gp36 major capsid-like protein
MMSCRGGELSLGCPWSDVSASINPQFEHAGWRSMMLLAKTEGALEPRFRLRAQWFGNHAIYNKSRSFDTSGAADVWLPDLRTGIPNNAQGNTGYTLIGYGANEVSTMTGTVAAAKILRLGDPQYFLIVDRVPLTSRGSLTRRPQTCAHLACGLSSMGRNSSVLLSANAFRVLVAP